MSALQTHSMASGQVTPVKARALLDQLLSPASAMESPATHEDASAVLETCEVIKDTAVHSAGLPDGADLILVSVPLDIDVAQLEGAEMLFPSASVTTGHIGSTIEVTTVRNEAHVGVHVLGMHEGVPSAAKVTAVYSMRYALPEAGTEEESIDFEALEALRTGECSLQCALVLLC
jgi:hypothetical protein